MRIESVETQLVYQWCFVRVRTDTGREGVGQSAYWGFPDAVERVIDGLRPVLIGQDPLEIGRLWQRMYRSVPFRGGVLTSAVAAVDLALWDLAGKHFEVPAYQLMGGRHRERVRLHLVLATGWLTERTRVEDVVAEAGAAVEAGFTAIKFDPFPEGPNGFQTDSHARMFRSGRECVAAVRDAVGWDVDIAIEGHRKLGPAEAVAFAHELTPFGIYMYEDALPPDSVDSWGDLAARTPLALGAGERNDTIYEFRELLARGAAHFVRPDVGTAGGLTQGLKIAALAEAHHAQVICHNYVSPLLTAATLQLYAAIPNVGTFEYTLLDEQSPRNLLLKKPLVREGGYLTIPEAPGLGVEVVDDLAEQFGPFARWRPQQEVIRPDGSLYTR